MSVIAAHYQDDPKRRREGGEKVNECGGDDERKIALEKPINSLRETVGRKSFSSL